MAGSSDNSSIVRFGLFEVDLQARELRKSGIRIKLQDQPFQILAMLLERPGEIITREELQKRLWPADTFVDFDLSLNSAVKKLRLALNDDSENPRFVETLYRRGYRFIAPVNGAPNPEKIQLAESGPAFPAPDEPVLMEAAPRPSPWRRRVLLYGSIPALLVGLAIGVYWWTPLSPPRVLGYTQITHDGLAKGGIFTDGERLYFQELQGDHFVVSQVSVAGGETSVVATPFQNAFPAGVAPNGSALLLGTFQGTEKGLEPWSVPLPSGPPRRLGNFVFDSATWSPDGSQLIFSRGPDIYQAKGDGSEPRKLATVGSLVQGLVFSPDARRFRFSVVDPRNGSSSIWELNRDGTGLHPLLPAWSSDPREFTGSWTPDEKYFLFQSFRDGRNSLWALPEKPFWFSKKIKPVQLTNGPLDFGSPMASKDSKRIFTVGSQPRCELMRYDSKSGFVPYMGGISARDVAFSADMKLLAYVSVPEGQLWRSKVDGSERLQLSFDPMTAALPRWSPDGKQIVFMAATLKSGWRAYLISSNGTGLRELIPGAEAGFDPGWSPDGKAITLALNEAGSPASRPTGPGIATVDLDTGRVSLLPGAQQLFSPRWSPDGRYIAAITNDSSKLMLFDRERQQWQELVSLPMGYPSWSHDGQYIYFDTTFTEEASFFRVRISDHKLERLVSLKGMHRYWGDLGSWTALAPDDSPLLIRDISNQEIYALDWEAP